MSGKVKAIDVHAHIFDEPMMDGIRRIAPALDCKLTDVDSKQGRLHIGHIQQWPHPRGAWDMSVRLKDMDDNGVDVQVLSQTPQTFLYDQDAAMVAETSRMMNERLADCVKKNPQRFMAIAAVPLQDAKKAADELKHAMTKLGLKGMQIGTNVKQKNLDDPALEPLWATAEELGAFILMHPQFVVPTDRFKDYYFRNFIGNPLETTIGAASLVFGGVMERHPRLKICLSHAGGYVPFQIGRFRHGWNEREESRKHLKVSPEASFRRFYFDTLAHYDGALQYVINNYTPDHVLMGSDYPFDMGAFDCPAIVRRQPISAMDKAAILHRNAEHLLNIG
jgi:aminocarboxymuconate-semialdehyde decarboxylase